MNQLPVIFYADDDADDIYLFQEAVKGLNAEVKVFPMGEAMLDAMYNPPPRPSMVFVDLNMPIRSGFEIIKVIKGSPFFSDIPVIVLSTASDPRTVNRARIVGADFFITKPPTLTALRNSIAHVLSIDWENHQTMTMFRYQYS